MVSDVIAWREAWTSGAIGIAGAIIGSVVSVAWTEWFNSRNRRRERRTQTRTSAYCIFHKINQIYSDITIIRRDLSSAHQKLEADRALYESGPPEYAPDGRRMLRRFFLHAYVEPYSSSIEAVLFHPEELTALLSIGGPSLLHEFNSLDRRHRSIIQSLEHYNRERTALRTKQTLSASEGTRATVTIDEADMAVAIDIAMLEKLLSDTRDYADQVAQEAFKAIKSLVLADTQPFGRNFSIEFPDPSGVLISVHASNATKHKARWWQFWQKNRHKK